MEESCNRVALFSTRFLPYSQTFVYDELRHHSRYRAEVFCLERMNAELFPYSQVHSLLPARGISDMLEARLYRHFLLSPRFMKLIQGGSYQLVHAHFGVGAQWALPVATRFDLPLVVTLHGFDVGALVTKRKYAPKHWRYALLSPWLLKRTTRFLAASEELAELIVRVGAPPRAVHVYRLGVELPPPVSSAKPSTEVLMVGRLVEKKGFEYGLRAFARIHAGTPDARLTIVGDGEQRDRLQALSRELGIEQRVTFAGALNHPQVLARMAACAVLLAPSITTSRGDRESGLIVVKEAAARAVPTIGTRHGGIPEIIDDQVTGYLVEERNVTELSERLHFLLSDGTLRAQMGQAARAKMEREYEIAERVRVLEGHYDEARREHRLV